MPALKLFAEIVELVGVKGCVEFIHVSEALRKCVAMRLLSCTNKLQLFVHAANAMKHLC